MSTSPGSELAGELPSVGERRRSRERALGLLYEAETKQSPANDVLSALINPPEPYAAKLVSGVGAHTDEIDALVVQHARAWKIDRMPAIDRAILRLATYELLDCADVPAAVVIDEAVDLAKDYSTEDSGRYVNGVLAAIAAALRPAEFKNK